MRNDQGIPGVTRRVRQDGGVKRCRVVAVGPEKGQVKYPEAGDALFGVTIDDAKDGRGVTLQTTAFAQIEAAEAFDVNARLSVGEDGRVSDASGDTDGFDLGGRAEHESTGEGDYVMVDIRQLGAAVAAEA